MNTDDDGGLQAHGLLHDGDAPVICLPSPDTARVLLRSATAALSARGLLMASRWSAEMVLAVRTDDEDGGHDNDDEFNSKYQSGGEWKPEECEHEVSDHYRLGKVYFDAKDYQRASTALNKCEDSKGRFLWFYSRFLLCEKKATEAAGMVLGPKDKKALASKELQHILSEMVGRMDPFELYLRAVLQSRLGNRLVAIDYLVQSVNKYQFNWSAWKLLERLIEGITELRAVLVRIPQYGFMSRFFMVHSMLETYNAGETMEPTLLILENLFPTSQHLRTQRALLAYHLRDFDTCEQLFDAIFEADPHRVEEVDTYSNILYVMEKKAKLTALAQRFSTAGLSGGSERMRPEVCCLLGNYWSLRGEHVKAIGEFRRAVRLDPSYLSAWTLMGHEYVELKNTQSAIEAYRRAVDCNSKDYRAWYGLGQTYEVLEMPYYSLHYYQRSVALRPYDTRMWLALSSTYEKLGRKTEAIKAIKRALLNAGVDDHNVLVQLASMLDSEGKQDEAVRFHRRIVAQAIADDGQPSPKLAKSYLYLAKYEMNNAASGTGDLRVAGECLQQIVQLNVDEKEEAKALLRTLAKMDLDMNRLLD